ncbi:MAG TPA: FAD:protein FMN transferase [Thermoanaerobaculia bacterium]|nr:FAD:protein FMN transferase [Thermoanaerobaculia bacterium]
MSFFMLLFLAGVAAPPPPIPPTTQPVSTPVRLATPAFGGTVDIEVRDLPGDAARGAIEAAFAEVAEVERLLSLSASVPGMPGGVAALNAAAGRGPQGVDPRLFSLLTKAADFCTWSEGAHGPLGRDLYTLWGARTPVEAPPDIERLGDAVGLAGCNRLALDPKAGTAALAEGAAVEPRGFAEGFAVDRAVEVLRQRGVKNGFVQIGAIRRGFGAGPQDKGWPVMLPPFPDLGEPMGRVYLRDQALVVATASDSPLRVGSGTVFPYISHRSGQPAQGVVAVLAATDLALDAQALTAALAILGPREGRLRLGGLRPQPSALWLLGSGEGAPLLVGHRWSEVPKR